MDTSVLINFALIGRLDLFRGLGGVQVLVSPLVRAEVLRPDESALVEEAIQDGALRMIEPTHEEESRTIDIRAAYRLGPGESECMALAAARGCHVACDEKGGRFRDAVSTILGPGKILNTPAIVVLALRQGSLTLAEADEFIEVWRRNRYEVEFSSFVEVMDPEAGGGIVAEEVLVTSWRWVEPRAETADG
jgi:predicted nucleic acid-binding protein